MKNDTLCSMWLLHMAGRRKASSTEALLALSGVLQHTHKQHMSLQQHPSLRLSQIARAFGMTARRILLGCVTGSYLTVSVYACVRVYAHVPIKVEMAVNAVCQAGARVSLF